MAVKKSGLGRGLDGMFPSYKKTVHEDAPAKADKTEITDQDESPSAVNSASEDDPEDKPEGGIKMVRISEVEPNPDQPRKRFNEEALAELSRSIRQHGVVQPLVVVRKDDYYMIVAGERRWRAAKLAGLKEVPVVIRDYTSQKVVEISLIENIQREDLDPIEEAMAYQNLIHEFNLRQEDIAGRVSKSRSTIANSLRLLKLDPRVQEMVISQEISAGHARSLLAVEDPEKQFEIAEKIKSGNLSVRETERLIKMELKKKKGGPLKLGQETNDQQIDYVYADIENQLQNVFGTKVRINRSTPQKGKIEIEYYSSEELERIFDILRSSNH